MLVEICRIITVLILTFFISIGLNTLIIKWQNTPVKEEKSVPIYITKEIKE